MFTHRIPIVLKASLLASCIACYGLTQELVQGTATPNRKTTANKRIAVAREYQKAKALIQSPASVPKDPFISGSIVANPNDADAILPPLGVIAIQEVNKYIYGGQAVAPKMDDGGWLTYEYGKSYPIVIATPLGISVIRLEKGEYILPDSKDLVGDPRLKVEPHTFGLGPDQQTFLVLKPKDAGTQTDLVFGTNKRLYTIHVIVKPHDYTPRVAFTYPDDWGAVMERYTEAHEEAAPKVVAPDPVKTEESGVPKNTRYSIKLHGKEAEYMRPLAVWDDGIRTHIDLPKNVASRDLPIPKIYSVKGIDSPNFRYDGTNLIIDAIFDKCILVSGVGRHQQKVTITNKQKVESNTKDSDA